MFEDNLLQLYYYLSTARKVKTKWYRRVQLGSLRTRSKRFRIVLGISALSKKKNRCLYNFSLTKNSNDISDENTLLKWIYLDISVLFDALNLFTLLCGYRSGRTVCLKKKFLSFLLFLFFFRKIKPKKRKPPIILIKSISRHHLIKFLVAHESAGKGYSSLNSARHWQFVSRPWDLEDLTVFDRIYSYLLCSVNLASRNDWPFSSLINFAQYASNNRCVKQISLQSRAFVCYSLFWARKQRAYYKRRLKSTQN